ncbi:M23 family metallopeptidase [Anabaena sphaerica FACHB-251]|uniref:M23 family metallopeptidase n=1 Tax=Anabaena sphaerica FACHB-251 TaxID=2692883 RepID=A0A926WG60_9NOST|nr:M23 family metallopeptidase [Anabaena sphaerica]MBD2293862.1 M23 family metallopeptidase [Anabaena sphaerica FACHB-251]
MQLNSVMKALAILTLPVIVNPLTADAATFANHINHQIASKQLIAQNNSPVTPLSSLSLFSSSCDFGGICAGSHQNRHNGVDFRASFRTEVRAICDGVVMEARTPRTTPNIWNRFTNIKHSNCAGYSELYGYYGHIDAIVRVGQRVTKGDVIGHVGD